MVYTCATIFLIGSRLFYLLIALQSFLFDQHLSVPVEAICECTQQIGAKKLTILFEIFSTNGNKRQTKRRGGCNVPIDPDSLNVCNMYT